MKLWVFGDSFSKKFEDKFGWDKKYTQWKGYFPKVYGEIVSETLGIELLNYGSYGFCNYDIFHSFVQVIDEINVEDIIIIQWGSTRLMRLADINDQFRTIDLNWNREYSFFKESQESIDTILTNRKSELYKQEIDDWIKVIKTAKPNNQIIFWTPTVESSGNVDMLPYYNFTTIDDETNHELKDSHLSETGHQEFAKLLIIKIMNNKKSNLI
jgi:hypothetical protein